MNKKGLRGAAAAIILFGLLAFTVSCAQDETARVTLFFGHNSQARLAPGPFERLLAFFSTPAYAAPDWNGDIDTLTLSVTGEGFDPITAVIPPAAQSYTLELPAGSDRLFVILATQGAVRKWGGRLLTSFGPGSVSLDLKIMPIISQWNNNTTAGAQITLRWSAIPGPTSVIGYNAYKAYSPEGPYVWFYTGAAATAVDNNAPGPEPYYYKVSVITPYGEGELSDYVEEFNNW